MPPFELSDYIAAISDFDDTILDNASKRLHELSRLDALRIVGAQLSLPALSRIPPELNDVAFRYASVHSVEGAFWWLLTQAGIIAPDTPVDPAHAIIRQLTAAKTESYSKLLATKAQEVPGASVFFTKLHACVSGRLAIASAGHQHDIQAFLDAHGLAGYFLPHRIIAKEHTTRPKPDPESFQKALASLGLTASDAPRTLAFEDDPRGIQAAHAIGLYTCAVTTRYSREELLAQPVQPDVIAADFHEYSDMFGL